MISSFPGYESYRFLFVWNGQKDLAFTYDVFIRGSKQDMLYDH